MNKKTQEKLLELYNYLHNECRDIKDLYYDGTFEEFVNFNIEIYNSLGEDKDNFESFEDYVDYEHSNRYNF